MKAVILKLSFIMFTIFCSSTLWFNATDAAAESQTMRDKMQTTVGGAEYFLTGEIINVEGNIYTLRTSGGETLRLEAADDTNMFCQSQSERSQSRQTSMSGQQTSSGAGMSSGMGSVSEKQKQAQESHAGTQTKGFRIGDCPFEKGEVIKAELTDKGTVTYMRSADPQTVRTWKEAEIHEGKATGRSTEEMGLPQEYVFLPAGALGSMQKEDTEYYPVKTSDGEVVGNVYKIILNNQGDPAYVILREKDTQQLKPLPWQAVRISPETESVALVMSRSQIDELPGYSPHDISLTKIRRFWEIAEAEKEARVSRQQARGQERLHEGPYEGSFESRYDRYSELGDVEDYPGDRGHMPGEAGEPGEVSIFGSPSTLPPTQHAPQYGHADKQRFRGDEFRHRGDQDRYQGRDRQRLYDRERQARFSDEFRSQGDRGRYDRGDRQQSFPRDRHPRDYDDFRSQRDGDRYDRGDRQRSFDRDRQSRYSDDFQRQGDGGRSMYSRSQERRSGMRDYDDRPDPYRP